ncbi:MAG TPA: CBS domain-containing protein [Candidatus Saccharimonadales bacterium]|nr:CBS domain-containing protein [Candidatus Saccharimonadales bacterium]
MNFFWAIVLLALALAVVAVRKTYYSVPLKEVKRKAERHDKLAKVIYPALAYGNSLRSLLWLVIGLLSAGSIILLARSLPVWVSLLIVGPILWIAFSWLPATRVSKPAAWLTKQVTPAIVWILNYLHPILSRSADQVEKRFVAVKHTGLFERDDLLELIEKQALQHDNRLTPEEIEIVRNALQFGDIKVVDALTSRQEIKTVLSDDVVGPILIDELHKAGQTLVLVRESRKGPVIGTLDFKQLGVHSKGHVRDVMNKTVYYLHENDSLSEALHAFFVTNHPVFVVVNAFEEYLGVITIEDILRQLLGHLPGDDFDQYSDLAAVAARHNHDHKEIEVDAEIDMAEEEAKENDDSEDFEVVEESDEAKEKEKPEEK